MLTACCSAACLPVMRGGWKRGLATAGWASRAAAVTRAAKGARRQFAGPRALERELAAAGASRDSSRTGKTHAGPLSIELQRSAHHCEQLPHRAAPAAMPGLPAASPAAARSPVPFSVPALHRGTLSPCRTVPWDRVQQPRPASAAARGCGSTRRLRLAAAASAAAPAGSLDVDVCILGAGILGLCTALVLLREDEHLKVALVDREVPCSGATGAGACTLFVAWVLHGVGGSEPFI